MVMLDAWLMDSTTTEVQPLQAGTHLCAGILTSCVLQTRASVSACSRGTGAVSLRLEQEEGGTVLGPFRAGAERRNKPTEDVTQAHSSDPGQAPAAAGRAYSLSSDIRSPAVPALS